MGRKGRVENAGEKRTARRREKDERRIEKYFPEIWKDWLPLPGPDVQGQLRLRMEDCDSADFSQHQARHSENLQYGEIREPLLLINPFNITVAKEDGEFDFDETSRTIMEEELGELDIAMYNVIEDPEETTDLRHQFPEIFEKLKRNVLKHLRSIVPEDFPPQDLSGHPRYFNGIFSPGWCSPR